MRNLLCLLILAASYSGFMACQPSTACGDLPFPAGSFPYPDITNKHDTDFYAYQLKDSLSTDDSFVHAYSGYYLLKAFDEQNLSVRYAGTNTFRFTYDSWGDTSFIILLTCKGITVKRGVSGWLYPYEDRDRLSKTERLHFNILERWFPLQEQDFSEERKHWADSLTRIYPQLLSAGYYRSLKEKSINHDTMPFKYSTKHIAVSPAKYRYFVDKIKASGFWSLPFRISNCIPGMDGAGYIFEANTSNGYKFVTSSICIEDTIALKKVCKELVDYARLKAYL